MYRGQSSADSGEAIAAVRGEADFENIGVKGRDGLWGVHVEDLGNGRAERGVVVESEEGIVVSAQAQFAFTAEHAVGDFATKFGDFDLEVAQFGADRREGHDPAFLDPRGAANDAYELAASGIGIDEVQVIRIGVFLNLDESGDFDIAVTGGVGRMTFDFESASGDAGGCFLCGDVTGLDHILEPFPANKHFYISLTMRDEMKRGSAAISRRSIRCATPRFSRRAVSRHGSTAQYARRTFVCGVRHEVCAHRGRASSIRL